MKKFFAILFLIILSWLLIGTAVQAADNNKPPSLLQNIPCALDRENYKDCTLCDFVKVLINGADIIMALSGAFAVLMFVYSGILMVTAYGNEGKITKGKDVLRATIFGLLIVIFAWTIISITLFSLYGTNDLQNSAFQKITGNANWNSSGPCAQRK